MKAIKKECNGRQFELDVSFDWDYAWIVMYEVIRPTWKIFRTRYIAKCTRNIERFITVDDAIDDAFVSMIIDLQKKEETKNKIKEFKKKSIDK